MRPTAPRARRSSSRSASSPVPSSRASTKRSSPTTRRSSLAARTPMGGGAELPTGVVTFLLSDIEGSSGLWERDPDGMACALELHDELIGRAVEATRRSSAEVQRRGRRDAVGVPARVGRGRLCDAAAKARSERPRGPAGSSCNVRIAVHTGEAHEREGDYFGPALNRAARLRGLARGGVTLVSQATTEIVRDRLPDERRAGRRRPARAARPVSARARLRAALARRRAPTRAGARAGADPAPAPAAASGCDRSSRSSVAIAELGRLHRAVGRRGGGGTRGGDRRRRGGHRQDPARRRARPRRAQRRSARALRALRRGPRCALPAVRGGAAPATRPRSDSIACGPSSAASRPTSRGSCPSSRCSASRRARDPETERYRLFEAVSALVEVATREQRALLVLDDLHWAAQPTLLMLRHLIRSERPLGALVLGTYRETGARARSSAGPARCGPAARRQRDEACGIAGLDERAIAALLEAAAGHALDERAAEFVRVLEAETGGNPFFIREVLAHLVESGAIYRAGERWTTDLASRRAGGARGASARDPPPRRAPVGASQASAGRGRGRGADLLARAARGRAGRAGRRARRARRGRRARACWPRPGRASTRSRTHWCARPSTKRTARRGGCGCTASSARRSRRCADADAHVEALAHHFAQAAADGQASEGGRPTPSPPDDARPRGSPTKTPPLTTSAACRRSSWPRRPTRRGAASCCSRSPRRAGARARWTGPREACRLAAELADRRGDPEQLARAALSFAGPVRFEVAAAVTRAARRPARTGARSPRRERERASRPRDEPAGGRAGPLGPGATPAGAGAPGARDGTASRRQASARRRARHQLHRDPRTGQASTSGGPPRQSSLASPPRSETVPLAALAGSWILIDLLERGEIDEAEQRTRGARPPGRRAVNSASRDSSPPSPEPGTPTSRDASRTMRRSRTRPSRSVSKVRTRPPRRPSGRRCCSCAASRAGSASSSKAVEDFADRYPEILAWRCALAWVYAELERRPDARRELEVLARNDFSDLPRDWAVAHEPSRT